MGSIGIYFEWGLFVVVLASGCIYLIDHCFFYQQRLRRARASIADFDSLPKKKRLELLRAPLLADYARSLFSVFLLVFLLRSFIAEPYIVPSGSMLPTIQLGDFVLVNKFAYGVRLPLLGTKIINVGEPKRGEVLVFENPVNPQTSFIKTVIGLPGDHISYLNKQLFINGKAVPQVFINNRIEPNNANLSVLTTQPLIVSEFKSTIGATQHTVFTTPGIAPQDFQNLTVPPHQYFVMGDNRDNSDDSRSWGFVPEANLKGRAWLIFFSWDSNTHSVRFDRIGTRLP